MSAEDKAFELSGCTSVSALLTPTTLPFGSTAGPPSVPSGRAIPISRNSLPDCWNDVVTRVCSTVGSGGLSTSRTPATNTSVTPSGAPCGASGSADSPACSILSRARSPASSPRCSTTRAGIGCGNGAPVEVAPHDTET